jgi:NAD(P)-dependent dehydrogenase (short-subunit alcohol dehydrogenase family)
VSRTDPEGPPVALITGANRGVGLEVRRQLARQGYSVLLGSRDAAKGERAARELVQDGQTVRSCQLDVTDLPSSERARARAAADFGRLDVLVNNAAIL